MKISLFLENLTHCGRSRTWSRCRCGWIVFVSLKAIYAIIKFAITIGKLSFASTRNILWKKKMLKTIFILRLRTPIYILAAIFKVLTEDEDESCRQLLLQKISGPMNVSLIADSSAQWQSRLVLLASQESNAKLYIKRKKRKKELVI